MSVLRDFASSVPDLLGMDLDILSQDLESYYRLREDKVLNTTLVHGPILDAQNHLINLNLDGLFGNKVEGNLNTFGDK